MVSSGVSDGQLNMPALVHSNNEQRTPGDKFSSKHTSSYRLIQTANPETATGQVLLSISRTTAILLIPKTTLPKTLSSSMLLLLLYLRARSLGGSGGTAAAARRHGGGVGWPVFSLRPIHAMSPQGSPNLVLPSIVQVGGICSTYVCMRAVCT